MFRRIYAAVRPRQSRIHGGVVVPGLDAIERHDKEGARAASRVKQAFVRVAVVAEFVKYQFGQPVGCVVFAEVVTDGLGESCW